MRTTVILTLVILLAIAGYGYQNNPKACKKLGHDLITVFQSPSEVAQTSASDSDTNSATASTDTTPAPATNPPPVPATPPPPPPPPPPPSPPPSFETWTPPSTMPAQTNWTWTTMDGKTYQNVVVTKIEPDTVTITHSLGVAHVDISTLPADIQKQLNYDPSAAAGLAAERTREDQHPYYALTSLADAQAAARQLHWPIAWICSDLPTLTTTDATPNSEDDLTQRAVNHLKTQAVIVFLDGNTDLGKVPAVLLKDGFFQMDDGPVPDGHHFYPPKIVFSDPDGTKCLGRVSSTQLKATGEAAIDNVLTTIHQQMQ